MRPIPPCGKPQPATRTPGASSAVSSRSFGMFEGRRSGSRSRTYARTHPSQRRCGPVVSSPPSASSTPRRRWRASQYFPTRTPSHHRPASSRSNSARYSLSASSFASPTAACHRASHSCRARCDAGQWRRGLDTAHSSGIVLHAVRNELYEKRGGIARDRRLAKPATARSIDVHPDHGRM